MQLLLLLLLSRQRVLLLEGLTLLRRTGRLDRRLLRDRRESLVDLHGLLSMSLLLLLILLARACRHGARSLRLLLLGKLL